MRLSHEVCVARDIQGLGQQRGQAELENRIVLLQVELEIYAGGGVKGILCILFICSSPPPPSPPPTDRQGGWRMGGRA